MELDRVLQHEQGRNLPGLGSKLNSPDLTLPGHNYLGPGTKFVTNLVSGLLPTDDADYLAMHHDYQYVMAESPSDIYQADRDFLSEASDVESILSGTLLATKAGLQDQALSSLLGLGANPGDFQLNPKEVQQIMDLFELRKQQYLKSKHNQT